MILSQNLVHFPCCSYGSVRCRSSPSSASPCTGGASLIRDDLFALIENQERGLRTLKDAAKRNKITSTIDALAELTVGTVTTDSSLSATWRMLWTTEKEQLFIIDKAPLFGTQAGDVLQVIDVEKEILNNVITFPPSGAFIVSSGIEVVSAQRVKFRFTGALLQTKDWKVALPPFGQGWFDTVYLDDTLRVARDIRGDYLIVDKPSYTWPLRL